MARNSKKARKSARLMKKSQSKLSKTSQITAHSTSPGKKEVSKLQNTKTKAAGIKSKQNAIELVEIPNSDISKDVQPECVIFQLKIYLNSIEPKIWRRIQVPENYTFHQLHYAIQEAFSWRLCHSHLFRISNKTFRELCLIMDADSKNLYNFSKARILEEQFTHLKQYLKRTGATYCYDNYEHVIILEKVLESQNPSDYPKCLDGKRSAPPEDCGGPSAYQYLVNVILRDKEHEEYWEKVNWMETFYPKFNPETFNPNDLFKK